MDHEIEHHVHVRAAVLERRQPRRLDEARHGQGRLHGLHGRIEALQVAHLQNPIGPPRQLDEALPLLHGHGHRLFDQNAGSGVEKILGDVVVQGSRRNDADGIHVTQKFAVIGIGRDTQFGRHRQARLRGWIGNADEV